LIVAHTDIEIFTMDRVINSLSVDVENMLVSTVRLLFMMSIKCLHSTNFSLLEQYAMVSDLVSLLNSFSLMAKNQF